MIKTGASPEKDHGGLYVVRYDWRDAGMGGVSVYVQGGWREQPYERFVWSSLCPLSALMNRLLIHWLIDLCRCPSLSYLPHITHRINIPLQIIADTIPFPYYFVSSICCQKMFFFKHWTTVDRKFRTRRCNATTMLILEFSNFLVDIRNTHFFQFTPYPRCGGKNPDDTRTWRFHGDATHYP